jgi:transaldolase
MMNATRQLHDAGQSLWLDYISRDMLNDGTLQRYIDDYAITGLTSNPTIFDKAIRHTSLYDDDIRRMSKGDQPGENIFFDLALKDLTSAADLFKPIHERTRGVDGWVSIEVSPLLIHDAAATVKQAAQLHATANRPNLFVKIPGTPEGNVAIEESIYAGVPINVTLLFSREQYLASAEAYLRGIERRIAEGLDPLVTSVASIFVSRWDKAVTGKVPDALLNRLGIAVGQQCYQAYHQLLVSDRMQRLENFGARPQRLLWASTGTKDPRASDVMYIQALISPHTINTMPEETLKAFAEHGKLEGALASDGGDNAQILRKFADAGIDPAQLANQLQSEGEESFSKSWRDLLDCIQSKSKTL